MDYLVELRAAHHVVCQVSQADLCRRPRVAYGSDIHCVHRVRHEPDDMLDPRVVSGFCPIADFLQFGEFMAPVAFFLNHVRHAALIDGFFLADICGVCVQALAFIIFSDKGFEFLGVMN